MQGFLNQSILFLDIFQNLHLSFLTRAILAGVGIVLVAAPMGSVIVWRRMANFGDTLAHATLLGASLALFFHVSLYLAMILLCLVVAIVLGLLSRRTSLSPDTYLTIISHSTLALGLVCASVLPNVRVDLLEFLYGDILAIRTIDLYWIYGVSFGVLFILIKLWRPLLSITVHEEIASVEGLPIQTIKAVFILLMAIVFAISMKLMGALLITALFVIPASSARQLAKTPEQMVLLALGFGIISIFVGIGCSQYYDWPTGPAIVVSSAILFVVNIIIQTLFKRHLK